MGYDSEPVGALLSQVASPSITPGGGTCAAVVGATGAALCEMGCVHTVGKDGYGDVEAALEATGEELRAARDRLLGLADADAAAARTLFDAIGSGEDTERAAKRATGVPLAVAETCVAVLEAAATVVAQGTDTARPDVVTGALCVEGARRGALFTVRTNADFLADDSFVADIERRAADIDDRAASALAAIDDHVGSRLWGGRGSMP